VSTGDCKDAQRKKFGAKKRLVAMKQEHDLNHSVCLSNNVVHAGETSEQMRAQKQMSKATTHSRAEMWKMSKRT